MLFFFFFSSRRRHTRLQGDWSSDVCSSDLSSATVIESYAGAQDGQYFTNAVVELVLKDGARLEHYKVQRESNKAFHIATTEVDLGPNTSYDTTTITFGG